MNRRNGWTLASILLGPAKWAESAEERTRRHEQALIFLHLAAEVGHPRAQYRLGRVLLGCSGSRTLEALTTMVRRDRSQGLSYLKRVARLPRSDPSFAPKYGVAAIDALAFGAAPGLRDASEAFDLCQAQKLSSAEASLRLGQLRRLGYGGRRSDGSAENNFNRVLKLLKGGESHLARAARWRLAEVILFGRAHKLSPERRRLAASLLEGQTDPRALFVRARGVRAGYLPGGGESAEALFRVAARKLADPKLDPYHERLLMRCQIEFEGWAGHADRAGVIRRLREAPDRTRNHPLVLAQVAVYGFRALDRSDPISPWIIAAAERAGEGHAFLGKATYLRLTAGNSVHPLPERRAKWAEQVGDQLPSLILDRGGGGGADSGVDLKTKDPQRR